MDIKSLNSFTILSDTKEAKELKKIKYSFLTGILHKEKIDQKYIKNPNILFKELNEIGKKNDVIIQLIDSSKILNKNHIILAIYYGNLAFLNKTNISNTLGLEYLIYSSTQRQIHLALSQLGLNFKSDTKNIQVVIIFTGKLKESILASKKEIKRLLNIELDEEYLNSPSREKLNKIKALYQISDFEIKNALLTIGYDEILDYRNINLKLYENALLNCLNEKITLLSLEK